MVAALEWMGEEWPNLARKQCCWNCDHTTEWEFIGNGQGGRVTCVYADRRGVHEVVDWMHVCARFVPYVGSDGDGDA